MSIDAVIERMEVIENDLVLHLGPRAQPDVGYPSEPGQPELTVLNYTKKPLIGEAIWGNSGECLTTDTEIRYIRIGYTRLREAHN
jgi:hypothetical protein